jgi:L-threonylcarbamoyladenylate synthase
MHTHSLTPATYDRCLRDATALLLAGGVAVIPTDTVYGLAAHPAQPAAVQRLYTIKGRLEAKPIALLAADTAAVIRFGGQLAPAACRLAAACWPGALTLVLPCGQGPDEGFRVPAHDWTRALLAACGGVLRVTSANLSGALPAASAVAALQDVGLAADLVIDDGTSPGGVASSVVRLTALAPTPTILRAGAIPAERILAISAAPPAPPAPHPTT